MTARIPKLIEKKDSAELVLEVLGALLLEETRSQAILANDAGKDSRLWEFRVFIEASSPWDYVAPVDTEDDSEISRPVVNVWRNGDKFDKSGSTSVLQNGTTTYYLDVYAPGTTRDNPLGGHTDGALDAALNAQRTARLVRNIIMDPNYRTLGTPLGAGQVVRDRWIEGIDFFQTPKDMATSAQKVAASRIELAVQLIEQTAEAEPVTLESLGFHITRGETGELLFEARYPSS